VTYLTTAAQPDATSQARQLLRVKCGYLD